MSSENAIEVRKRPRKVATPAGIKAVIEDGIVEHESEDITTASATEIPRASNTLSFDVERRWLGVKKLKTRTPTVEDAAEASEVIAIAAMDCTLYSRDCAEHPKVRAARRVLEAWAKSQQEKT